MSFTPITSSLPKQLNRIINVAQPDCHFCCNLNYLTIKPGQNKKITSWQNAKTLVIDFTTGAVMDCANHLRQILDSRIRGNDRAYGNDDGGIVYGWLDQAMLNKVWQIVTKGGVV